MLLSKGKFYLMHIQVGDRVLSFAGEIVEIDDDFVSFVDKYGKLQNYRLSTIMSYTEVEK